jgi:von Willebrand factor type A domain
MKRIIPAALVGCLMVFATIGCDQNSEKSALEPAGDAVAHAEKPLAGAPAREGGDMAAKMKGTFDKIAPAVKPADAAKTAPAVAEAIAGTSTPKVSKQSPLPPAGIVTAGSFDDNLDPAAFARLCQKSSHVANLAGLPALFTGHRLLISVKDGGGKPVNNARVRLTFNDGQIIESATRSDGRAIFVSTFDHFSANQNLLATITPPEGANPVTDTIVAGADRWDFTLPKASGALPKNLDLAIVLDTTGSMGDEIRHLQAEIKGITGAIQEKFPDVQMRFALVLYRDDGDEYVTRGFDFTRSLDEFHKNLSAQRAAGGGDYPEAVHRGLEDAAQLRWRENSETACLMFLVGDAPPHAQHMARTMKAVDALRKKGVAIYPVACSGYDDACEFVMRSSAYLTGGKFLFLTDDSGVGGSHAEPRIPYYQVERLEKLMIRMISSELSGHEVPAESKDIIRTVGRKIN